METCVRLRPGVRLMKAINFAGGWCARVSCRGSESDIESFKTKLGGFGLVKPVRDDDRREEQTVPWSEWSVWAVFCLVVGLFADSMVVDT